MVKKQILGIILVLAMISLVYSSSVSTGVSLTVANGTAPVVESGGGGGSYTPPVSTNQTSNETGILFSTSGFSSQIFGQITVGHLWMIVLSVLFVLSFRLTRGNLKYVKYVILIAIAISYWLMRSIL